MAKDASEVINETAEAQKPNQPQPTMERLIADMSDREILELIGKLSKRIDKTTQREKDSKVKSWIAENKSSLGTKMGKREWFPKLLSAPYLYSIERNLYQIRQKK